MRVAADFLQPHFRTRCVIVVANSCSPNRVVRTSNSCANLMSVPPLHRRGSPYLRPPHNDSILLSTDSHRLTPNSLIQGLPACHHPQTHTNCHVCVAGSVLLPHSTVSCCCNAHHTTAHLTTSHQHTPVEDPVCVVQHPLEGLEPRPLAPVIRVSGQLVLRVLKEMNTTDTNNMHRQHSRTQHMRCLSWIGGMLSSRAARLLQHRGFCCNNWCQPARHTTPL